MKKKHEESLSTWENSQPQIKQLNNVTEDVDENSEELLNFSESES